MGCDETLMSCVNQDEQSLASWNDQENMTPNNAQYVDDKSSRSESLQCMSNAVQSNDVNVSKICEVEYYPLRKRNLLNSAVGKFVNGGRKYKSSYKLPPEHATFGGRQRSFDAEYTPLDHELKIEMPVNFMPPTDLHRLDSEIPSGTMSEDATTIEGAYKAAVKRGWSGKYKFNLDAKNPVTNGLCYDWSYVPPVHVDVSVKRSSADSSYKIYYYKGSPDDYRDGTWSKYVIFSEDTFDRENDQNRRDSEQNVFAHEFGHQIGLDDEYPVDYENGEYDQSIKAYDRSTGRANTYDLEVWFDLSNQERPFRHNGMYYWVKKNGSKYYLEYVNGGKRKTCLDGMYTSHTQMAADEFGYEYAHKNATMYDKNEKANKKKNKNKKGPGLEENMMNEGNVIKPHYYIPFKKAMVNAIQKDYNSSTSEAPNLEEDWKIE